MVESFRNTLQDVFTADLVILVVDSSEPLYNVSLKVAAVQEILGSGVPGDRILVALNKSDADPDRLGDMVLMVQETLIPMAVVTISALTGEGVDELMKIVDRYFRPPVVVRFSAANTSKTATEISRIYDSYYVESVEYSDIVKVVFRCTSDDLEIVMDEIYSLPGVKDVSSADDSLIVR
jgi:GTP-binding protein HflX